MGYFQSDEWSIEAGVFTPAISKAITNPQTKYKFGDVVYFDITVTNTAEYAINTVQIMEQLNGVEFLAGSGYTVSAPRVAVIPILNAGSSITLRDIQ